MIDVHGLTPGLSFSFFQDMVSVFWQALQQTGWEAQGRAFLKPPTPPAFSLCVCVCTCMNTHVFLAGNRQPASKRILKILKY